MNKLEKSRTFFIYFLVLAGVIFSSFLSFYKSWYSVLLYDLAKVVSYFNNEISLLEYIKKLSFGVGISLQAYPLMKYFSFSPSAFQLAEYSIFVTSFAASILFVFKYEKALFLILAGLLVSIFFQSDLLVYLGSYGMLVYGQQVLSGFFLLFCCLYFSRVKNIKNLDVKKWFLFLLGVAFVTFFDIRTSFYFFIMFLVFLIFGDKEYKKDYFKIGISFGVIFAFMIVFVWTMSPMNWTKFKPAHVLKMLLPSSGLEVHRFIYFTCNNLIESLVGNNNLIKVFFITGLGVGIGKNIIKKGKLFIPVIVLISSVLILILGSLFDFYPFGSIRYGLQLIPLFFVIFLDGVKWTLNLLSKSSFFSYGFSSFFLGVGGCFVFFFHYYDLQKSLIVHQKIYKRENGLVSFLNEQKVSTYCDAISQKMLKAYGRECKVITQYNITLGKPAKKEIFDKFKRMIEEEKGDFLFVTYRNLDDAYWEPYRNTFNKHGFFIKEERLGFNKYYLFSRK